MLVQFTDGYSSLVGHSSVNQFWPEASVPDQKNCVPELALTNVRKAFVSTRPLKLKNGSLKRISRHAIAPSKGNFWMSELVKVASISGPALLKALCKSETRGASPCRGMNSDTTEYRQKTPNAATKSNITRTVIFIAIRLTLRLRHAGPMMSDCQLRRDPGVACSRFVERSRCAAERKRWLAGSRRLL
jgi:hypothetical protein